MNRPLILIKQSFDIQYSKNLNITILNSTHSSEDLIDYDKELSFSVKNEKTIIEEVKSNRSNSLWKKY